MKSFDKMLATGARHFTHFAAAISILAVSGCAGTYYYQQPEPPPSPPPPPPVETVSVTVGVEYFYEDLAPYGRWMHYPAYGWVWAPYDCPYGWRPYSDGHWAYTDYGWSWVSYEPHGWATYHYGRWAFEPHYGWIWVPDTVWAPAWVAWHSGGGYVGWAPLPPAAQWRPSTGMHFAGVHAIPSNHWCFVEGHSLSHTKLKSSIVSVAKNSVLLKRTKDKTRYVMRNGTPVNEGVDVAAWENETGRKAPRLKVVDASAPPRGRGPKSTAVEYYRPKVREEKGNNGPSREIRELVISDSEVRKQSEIERKQMEDGLARERAELERQHQKELQGAKKKAAADEIKKRQAAENEALEQHAAEQREALKERQQKKIVKVERSSSPGKKKQAQSEEQSPNDDPEGRQAEQPSNDGSATKTKPTKNGKGR